VRSAFAHEGAARLLIHRLKYEGVPMARICEALACRLPADAAALVPIPRVVARVWRYGVDPAREIAAALSKATGLPVVDCLRPSVWDRRRAGTSAATRHRPAHRLAGTTPPRGVLVDDVVTTGSTVASAAAVSGLRRAVTLTAALRP
jgi:predicted amidophosphoribosyltransferase